MKRKHLISLITAFVVVIMTVYFLSACTRTNNNTQSSGQRTITWMTIRANTPAWDSLIRQYEQENPGVKIEMDRISDSGAYYQKLRILAASNALPEMFDTEADATLVEIASTGVLLDIDSLYKELNYDRMLEIGLNYARLDNGKLYSISWENNIEYIWYNKDLFAKAGIEKTPETFDEFLDVCQRLRNAGISPISVSGINVWAVLRYMAFIPFRLTGNTFIENLKVGDARMSDPIGIQAATFVQTLGTQYFQPGWATCDYTTALQNFLSGNAAMYNIGSWQFGSFIDSNRELRPEYGFFYIPTIQGAINGKTDMVAHAGTGTAVRKDKFDDQLKHFIKFMLDKFPETFFYETGSFPAMTFDTSLGYMSNFDRQVMSDSNNLTSHAKPWDVEFHTATNEVMNREIGNLGMGTITPQEFARRIDDAIARNVSRR